MKLTPLNISQACILVWAISESSNDQTSVLSWGWLVFLLSMIIIVDLGFRMLFKDLKQLWFLQIGFILLVGILMIILKIQ